MIGGDGFFGELLALERGRLACFHGSCCFGGCFVHTIKCAALVDRPAPSGDDKYFSAPPTLFLTSSKGLLDPPSVEFSDTFISQPNPCGTTSSNVFTFSGAVSTWTELLAGDTPAATEEPSAPFLEILLSAKDLLKTPSRISFTRKVSPSVLVKLWIFGSQKRARRIVASWPNP